MPRILVISLLLLVGPLPAYGQMVADTTFEWRSYSQTGRCAVQIFQRPDEDDRPYTFVVRELAANGGPSTVADIDYLVREIGRRFSIDPAKAYWLFHWGAFSFEGAEGGKELFLRATFGRSGALQLSSPRWKVVTREEVDTYTDRMYRHTR